MSGCRATPGGTRADRTGSHSIGSGTISSVPAGRWPSDSSTTICFRPGPTILSPRSSSQDFYGVVREWGPRWFLWAGFCSFRFDRVGDKALDFGQDWFKGLDTGGGNWRALYRHVDRARIREARSRYVPFKAGIEMRDGPLQWCGSWLHEVGLMGRSDLQAEKRRAVAEMLAPHLAAAGRRLGAKAEPDRQPEQ